MLTEYKNSIAKLREKLEDLESDKSDKETDLILLDAWQLIQKKKIKNRIDDISIKIRLCKYDLEKLEKIKSDLETEIKNTIDLRQALFVKYCLAIVYTKLVYKNIFTSDLYE